MLVGKLTAVLGQLGNGEPGSLLEAQAVIEGIRLRKATWTQTPCMISHLSELKVVRISYGSLNKRSRSRQLTLLGLVVKR